MAREGGLFDDLSRVASGAMSSVSALREEAEARLRDRLEDLLARADLVRREEFEAVEAMAVKAREENAALAARIEALEAQLTAAKRPAPRRKAAPKKDETG